jgi:hypothetical protein
MLKAEIIKHEDDTSYCSVEVSATERGIAIELSSLLEAITEKGYCQSIHVALEVYTDYLKGCKGENEDADN